MIITNARLILPDKVVEGSVEFNNGIITHISEGDAPLGQHEAIDARGMYLSPGFVDIHTHGGGGIDFMDDEPYTKALKFHALSGTTSLLPTAITAPPALLRNFAARVRKEIRNQQSGDFEGARILGAHMEGPYLSVKNKGAHPLSCLLVPSRDSYDFLLENADVIRTVTIAPELDGAEEMIRALKKAGITVCGGHDDGRQSTLAPAIAAGVTHLTHLWCAMSKAELYDGVREPGLLEIGLSSDSLTAEIIADGHHMPPELVEVVYRCKGASKLCIVSDCLRAGGMPKDGRIWTLGRECDRLSEFIVGDGVARLPDKTRLAGSIQPLSQMVKNLVFDCNIPLCDAVRMATLTPAEVIGEENSIGSLSVGKQADLCLLDSELNVKAVYIGGRKIV